MQSHPSKALALLVLLAASPHAFAQCELSTFGRGTGAIDRRRAILADREIGLPPHVHFFEKTAHGWQPGATHVVGDLDFAFPTSVALDGDRAIAGSAESNGIIGRAFLFDRVGDRWVPTELLSPTTGDEDFFGAVVDVSGDVAVVGAAHPYHGVPALHVFELQGSNWTEVAVLPISIGALIDAAALDLEADTILLGEDKVFPGLVRVYERIAGTWTAMPSITVPTPLGGCSLGSSLALQGDTLVVGAASAHQNFAAGFVEVFRRVAGGWQSVQHILPSDSSLLDRFGSSVALSGTTLLVGAPAHGGPGSYAGRVYRFEHDGTTFVETGDFGPQTTPNGLGAAVAFQREDAILSGSDTISFWRLGFADQTSYCPTTPNSTGASARLSVEGCDSLGGRRLTLIANHLPPNVLGFSFFGASTEQVPFGDGFRCVAEPFFRFPAERADATGHLVHDVDFASGPASNLVSGRTWHFQTCHRDPASSGARLNLTNALSIGITP